MVDIGPYLKTIIKHEVGRVLAKVHAIGKHAELNQTRVARLIEALEKPLLAGIRSLIGLKQHVDGLETLRKQTRIHQAAVMLKGQDRAALPRLSGLVVQMDGALERKRQIVLEHAIVFAPILGSGKLAQIGKGRHGTKCEIKQVLFNAKHGNPYARF